MCYWRAGIGRSRRIEGFALANVNALECAEPRSDPGIAAAERCERRQEVLSLEDSRPHHTSTGSNTTTCCFGAEQFLGENHAGVRLPLPRIAKDCEGLGDGFRREGEVGGDAEFQGTA